MYDAHIVLKRHDVGFGEHFQTGQVVRLSVDRAEKVLGEANGVDLYEVSECDLGHEGYLYLEIGLE